MIQPEDKRELIKFCIVQLQLGGFTYDKPTKLVNVANDMAEEIIKLSEKQTI